MMMVMTDSSEVLQMASLQQRGLDRSSVSDDVTAESDTSPPSKSHGRVDPLAARRCFLKLKQKH